MATVIRPVISENNKYYIDKHRYYELKHFCLQYSLWKKAYAAIVELSASTPLLEKVTSSNVDCDMTAKCAIRRAYYSEKINLIETTAKEADEYLWHYIVKGVTEGLSFTHLKTKLDMPCGRDMYYDRYRKFFWLLSEARQ